MKDLPEIPAAGMDADLVARLARLRMDGLHRELRRIDSPQSPRVIIGGRECLNFSSNDYLGLANDPLLKEAAIRAIEQFGSGSGSARLISGSLAPHHELEETLARFKGTDAALAFSSGYAAAVGTITALVDKNDVVVLDKLVHASVVDAARLSGAKLRVFPHNDLNALAEILAWADTRRESTSVSSRPARTLIVTESVFSMDGDHAPLREMVALKERHGAWLMVDEAHATGLYGANRRGLIEAAGVAGRVDVQMGTLSKAIGSSGGYICGSRTLIDYLINRARSFIFSTAPPPSASAAADAGVRFISSEAGGERCRQLRQLVLQFHKAMGSTTAGWVVGDQFSAIVPVMIGSETDAVAAATKLRERGIYVPAIRYPTVARGAARLRVTLTASHSAEDTQTVMNMLRSVLLSTC